MVADEGGDGDDGVCLHFASVNGRSRANLSNDIYTDATGAVSEI